MTLNELSISYSIALRRNRAKSIGKVRPEQARVVLKLRWQDFFFEHLPPCIYIFYAMNVDKNWTLLRPPTYRLPTYLVL